MASYHMVIAERSKMTDAAKWKEFLRWWKAEDEWASISWTVVNLIYGINKKIEKLQKGDNAKQ